jgi:hypothetical protein
MWALIRLGLWLDIFITFFMEVAQEEFEEPGAADWRMKNIACHYALGGWLLLDLLAAIPLPHWQLGNCLIKFTKVYHLYSHLWSVTNLDTNSKVLRRLAGKAVTMLRLGNLFFLLLLIAHWVSCGWYAVQWLYGDPCDPATYDIYLDDEQEGSDALSTIGLASGGGGGGGVMRDGAGLMEENWSVMQQLCTTTMMNMRAKDMTSTYMAHIFWVRTPSKRPFRSLLFRTILLTSFCLFAPRFPCILRTPSTIHHAYSAPRLSILAPPTLCARAGRVGRVQAAAGGYTGVFHARAHVFDDDRGARLGDIHVYTWCGGESIPRDLPQGQAATGGAVTD